MGRRSLEAGVALFCAVALVVPAVLLAGCGGGGSAEGSPGKAAESFLNALIAHNNPSSYALLSLKSQGEMGVTPMTWPGVMMANPIPSGSTFTVKGESIQGDTATVTITTTTAGADRTVNLVNEEGEWLVDYQLGEWYGLAPGL